MQSYGINWIIWEQNTVIDGTETSCTGGLSAAESLLLPAVSEQYVVPRENPWVPSEEAHQVMQELAATVEDKKLLRCLKFYQKHPWKRSAKKIAGMLQEKRHAEVTVF